MECSPQHYVHDHVFLFSLVTCASAGNHHNDSHCNESLIDFTQASEMIRSTPEDSKGTTYDKLCEFVKLCQAAENVRAKSMVMKHNEFATLVDLLESYDIDIPPFYFRSAVLQFCQSELRQSHMDIYLDSSAGYIDLNIDNSDPELKQ